MKKENVLYIFNRNEIGGATKSMLSLVTYTNKKCNVIVLTPKKKFVYEYCKQNNINVIYLPYLPILFADHSNMVKSISRRFFLPLFKVMHFIINNISYIYLSKVINLNKIDLIHTNIIRDDFGCLISKRKKIAHVVHLREFGEIDYKYIYLKKDYLNYFDKYTSCFIAISDAIKRHYINKGINDKKIIRVYNGVDVDKIKSKTEPFVEKGKLRIIFTGGIIENKGQLDLLKALNLLDSETQKNIIVDLYGKEDINYLNKLKKYIVDNKIKSQIQFKGYVNNINDIMKNYDVGVMCSTAEAFGRTTVEYMAAGLIVIASDGGANCELITDKYNGFIYKKEDINTFSKIIYSLINGNVDFNEISRNSQKYSTKEFSSLNNANNVLSLYKDVLGGIKIENNEKK